MENTEIYGVVIKHIYYDLFTIMGEDATLSLLKADDMLPVMAATMTRVDWENTPEEKQNSLAKAVRAYLWKHPRIGCYTKRALIRRFKEEWLPTLTKEEKESLVKDFRMFTGFDDDGYAIPDEKTYNTYKELFKKGINPLKFMVIQIPTLPKGTRMVLTDDEDYTVYHSEEIDGYWTVPTIITAEQWYEILHGVSDRIKVMLSCYLQMPGYRAGVHTIEKVFGVNQYTVNACNTALGRRARNYLGNFEVRDPDGIYRLWSIPMNRGRNEDGMFAWEMRPELAEAAKRYLDEIGFVYKSPL